MLYYLGGKLTTVKCSIYADITTLQYKKLHIPV